MPKTVAVGKATNSRTIGLHSIAEIQRSTAEISMLQEDHRHKERLAMLQSTEAKSVRHNKLKLQELKNRELSLQLAVLREQHRLAGLSTPSPDTSSPGPSTDPSFNEFQFSFGPDAAPFS
jgi:hypothetical protein